MELRSRRAKLAELPVPQTRGACRTGIVLDARPTYMSRQSAPDLEAMIYLLAVFIPPLGLLLNGQPFAAIFNVILIVPCIVFGLIFHVLLLVPSLHAVLAIYMKRGERKHRELVNAIERHGPPPGWRP